MSLQVCGGTCGSDVMHEGTSLNLDTRGTEESVLIGEVS